MNFIKFLRTPFLQNTSERLLLKFDETAVTKSSGYFPDYAALSGFLEIFQKWWTIKQSFTKLGQIGSKIRVVSLFLLCLDRYSRLQSQAMLMNEIFENLTNLIGKVNFKTTHLRGGCHNEDMSGGPFLTGHLTGYLFLERKFNRWQRYGWKRKMKFIWCTW